MSSLPLGEPIAPDAHDPRATAFLYSSSGTTGLPKSVVQSHEAAVALLRQLAAVPLTRARPDDVLAGIVPFAHVFGSASLNHALRAGAKIITLPRFELEAFLRMIEEHRVTMVFAVPPIARALARHPMVNRFDLSSLRLVMLSAAPCPAELELECEARLGCTVGQALGMTEGAPVSLPSEPVCHGSAGLLAASTEGSSSIRTAASASAPEETGELWVRGPQVMRGSWATRSRRSRRSTPTAGCAAATWCASTRTVICSWSKLASRSSSRCAAITWRRRSSRPS